MAKFQFELDEAGVRELLKSPEMLEVCKGLANDIVSRLGDGYEVDPFPGGKNRVNVGVRAASKKAFQDCLKNNTLLKAVH